MRKKYHYSRCCNCLICFLKSHTPTGMLIEKESSLSKHCGESSLSLAHPSLLHSNLSVFLTTRTYVVVEGFLLWSPEIYAWGVIMMLQCSGCQHSDWFIPGSAACLHLCLEASELAGWWLSMNICFVSHTLLLLLIWTNLTTSRSP